MGNPRLVLDTSILSALETADWFDAPAFYSSHEILASSRVWNGEFVPHHDMKSPPVWLAIEEVKLESVETASLGQLSRADWSCIALAEAVESATIITNDRALRDVAKRRELNAVWGTKFVLETFEECGITEDEFEAGIESYISDVTISERVEDELRTAEKPE